MSHTATDITRIKKLLAAYEQGIIPRLQQHEVNPGLSLGSRENYLYFTLPVCINFQRNSPAMWAAALATWQDESTRYVFMPERLAETPVDQIRSDLTKHKLALQPNKHVLIWTTIAKTLHDFYGDDPRHILAEADYDAGQLIHNVQIAHRARFPYLSGPKLSNYWPYILSQFTDAIFKNPHMISIIPDTHVIQSSVRLGIVPPGSSAKVVEGAWRQLLNDSGILSTQMHAVLWYWSRNGFIPDV